MGDGSRGTWCIPKCLRATWKHIRLRAPDWINHRHDEVCGVTERNNSNQVGMRFPGRVRLIEITSVPLNTRRTAGELSWGCRAVPQLLRRVGTNISGARIQDYVGLRRKLYPSHSGPLTPPCTSRLGLSARKDRTVTSAVSRSRQGTPCFLG